MAGGNLGETNPYNQSGVVAYMTKRTRLFLLIAAGVLVVGLGTGLLASFMGLQTLTFIGSDGPEELAYVPQDTGLVAFANVRDVMDSELRQKLLQMRPDSSDPDGNDFETKTGITIETDIDRVVASLGGGGAEDDRALVLARGRFDEVRIEGLVRERGGEVEEYKDKRLLTIDEGDHTLGLAFVEPGLVAFGTAAAVRRAIDTKSGAGSNVTRNDELMALVRDIDESNAWAVGRFDAMARGARLPQEITNRLPPINWFSASGYVNGGVQGLVRAEATNEEAAGNLREVIRGFMALVRLQTGQNAEMTALVNSLQLGGEGKTVSLAFSVPPEVIDALAAMQRRDRGARPAPDPDGNVGTTPDPPAPPQPPAAPRPPTF